MLYFELQLLRRQDSNLRPIDYVYSIVTNGTDYIISVSMKDLGARRFPLFKEYSLTG